MPLELPNLDDRTYQDLVDEALSLIPTYAPEWTNFNPSDPGITLIELFAYMSEILIYRLNRVSDANRQAFLNLIVGLDTDGKQKYPQTEPLSRKELNDKLRDAIQTLRESERAVTGEDFERLAMNAYDINKKRQGDRSYIDGDLKIARAHCIPRRDLTFISYDDTKESPGHISLVIVPPTKLEPSQQLKENLTIFLESYRLLTTKINVVGPVYIPIGVNLTLVLKEGARQDTKANAEKVLKGFFDPLKWSFGRNVYVSDIYELLDKVEGVDYVTKTEEEEQLTTKAIKRRDPPDESQPLIGINLRPNELVKLDRIELIMATDPP